MLLHHPASYGLNSRHHVNARRLHSSATSLNQFYWIQLNSTEFNSILYWVRDRSHRVQLVLGIEGGDPVIQLNPNDWIQVQTTEFKCNVYSYRLFPLLYLSHSLVQARHESRKPERMGRDWRDPHLATFKGSHRLAQSKHSRLRNISNAWPRTSESFPPLYPYISVTI
jgi:hypothetical protein